MVFVHRTGTHRTAYAWDHQAGHLRVVGEPQRRWGGNWNGYSNWNYQRPNFHHHHSHGRMSNSQLLLGAVLVGTTAAVAGSVINRGSAAAAMQSPEMTGETRLSPNFMAKISDGVYSQENLMEADQVRRNAWAAGDGYGYRQATYMMQRIGYQLQFQHPHTTAMEDMKDQATSAAMYSHGRYGLIGQLFS